MEAEKRQDHDSDFWKLMNCIKEENKYLEEMENNNKMIGKLVRKSKRSTSQSEENSRLSGLFD